MAPPPLPPSPPSPARPEPATALPARAQVALATSYASPARDADGYLDVALRLGAQSLILVPSDTIPADLSTLVLALGRRRQELRVRALEAQLGALHLGQPAAWHTRPCALDRDEAQAAVAVTRAAMDLAVQLGAEEVIVSLGSVGERGDGGERLWQALFGKLRRGVLLYDDSAAQELRGLRAALAGRHLDAALRSVEQMLEDATRRGRRLVLRSPARGLELPAAYELAAIRSTFAGAPLTSLLDLPAAHLCSTLRLLSLRETVLSFAAGAATTGDGDRALPALANLADACGEVAGLPPGTGEAQPERIARALPAPTERLFVPAAQLSLRTVAEALRAVAAL